MKSLKSVTDMNANLLEIVSGIIEEIMTEAASTYGLNRCDFRACTGGQMTKVQAVVCYQRQVIFKVGISAGSGLEYFLEMTKDQARDAFASYFALEGEVA